ncbi:MAG: hypothetical protein V5A55_02850 [Halovenus sp.]
MDELPVDVRDTLCQVLAEARRTDDSETALALLDTARRVSANKLADGDRRARLLHGCERATVAFEEGEPARARAYVTAMERRVCEDGD